jgi:hypothetical protein
VAARALDRYLRVRSRYAQRGGAAVADAEQPGPMTANGDYHVIANRGRQGGVDARRPPYGVNSAVPGWIAVAPEGDLRELNG